MERSAGVANQPSELPGEAEIVNQAYAMAARVHHGQKRKADLTDFLGHLARVAAHVKQAGADDEVVAAALLHDAVEKTDTAGDEIAEHFGERIRSLVLALSDDPSIDDYAERKRALRKQVSEAGVDAALIYTADKLNNLRDIRAVWESDPDAIEERLGITIEERVELLREDVGMVRANAPDEPLVDLLDAEVTAFERTLGSEG